MPKLNSQTLNTTSGFQFSAEEIENLDNDSYTLVNIAVDTSYSTEKVTDLIEKTVKSIIEGCKKDSSRESLLIRLTVFNNDVSEIIGYTLVDKILDSDIEGRYRANGMTALRDASVDAVESAVEYGAELRKNYYTSNAIIFVVTDGMENQSRRSVKGAFKNSVDKVKMNESLESIKTVLIGLSNGSPDISAYLSDFKDNEGFDDFIDAQNADKNTLAKIGGFVSQSISSTSKALGSGAASQSLTF